MLAIPLAGPVIELLADRVDRCIGFEAGIIIDEALLAELVEEVVGDFDLIGALLKSAY